jgi:membrane associated rhomboid family serine protease
MFNLPPTTKYFLGAMLAIHLALTFVLPEGVREWVIYHLGFVPSRFTDTNMVEALQIVTPITHMFIHGSWLHIAMNGFMLLAFGAGLEKMIGAKKMLQIFFISGLFGVALHFVLNLYSFDPVIGASGGLSGMFAAVLVLLNRQNAGMTGKYGIWPFIILWIGISILFGMMGSPDGSAIAWAAHIGGFLGGFVALRFLKI